MSSKLRLYVGEPTLVRHSALSIQGRRRGHVGCIGKLVPGKQRTRPQVMRDAHTVQVNRITRVVPFAFIFDSLDSCICYWRCVLAEVAANRC